VSSPRGDRTSPGSTAPPRWVFLDRDGTINSKPADGEYVTTPAQLRLLPGAAGAIRRLNDAGVWVGIVTNQRGVALGRMGMDDLEAVHERLLAELARAQARVDAVYACPHEQGTCTCRKPLPGMLLRASRDLGGIDFTRAAVVGDSLSDVQVGRSLGARTVLLVPQATESLRMPLDPDHVSRSLRPDHVGRSLAGAVDWLLE
jgi:D-glycero-D-manno-heptose 1,7-bisphosphate phosphatase